MRCGLKHREGDWWGLRYRCPTVALGAKKSYKSKLGFSQHLHLVHNRLEVDMPTRPFRCPDPIVIELIHAKEACKRIFAEPMRGRTQRSRSNDSTCACNTQTECNLVLPAASGEPAPFYWTFFHSGIAHSSEERLILLVMFSEELEGTDYYPRLT